MRFQLVLAACGLAVLLCPGAGAQSSTPAAPPSQQNSQQIPQGGLAPGAPPLQLQNLTPEEHTLTPAEQAEVQRVRAYQAAIRVASLTARWGPTMSTPGVSVTLVETARTKAASGVTQFTYQIAGTGFRAGEKLNLVRWPLGASVSTVMGSLVLNAQGIAVCGAGAPAAATASAGDQARAPAAGVHPAPSLQAGSSPPVASCTQTMQPDQPIQIQVSAAAGEPIRAALIAEDHSNGAATQTVPFPISDTDKSCTLQLLLGMKDADMVVVQGSGFPPNAKLKIETVTGSQTRTQNATTDPGGHTALAILPAVGGQTAGTTTVRYAGVVAPAGSAANGAAASPSPAAASPAPATAAADGGCAPAVTFHWGQDSYKPE